jgi:MFS family permease
MSTRTPVGINVGVGSVAIVVAGLVAAAIPTADPEWRFGVMAAAVGLFAAITVDHFALLPVAVLAFLVTNGFLEDRLGELSWHGSTDLWRLLLLVMIGTFGLAAGEVYRQVHALRARWRVPIETPWLPDEKATMAAAPWLLEEKEKRDA